VQLDPDATATSPARNRDLTRFDAESCCASKRQALMTGGGAGTGQQHAQALREHALDLGRFLPDVRRAMHRRRGWSTSDDDAMRAWRSSPASSTKSCSAPQRRPRVRWKATPCASSAC
jgi:hypothetical protein